MNTIQTINAIFEVARDLLIIASVALGFIFIWGVYVIVRTGRK